MHQNRRHGFSFVEVLVTISMIGLTFYPMLEMFAQGLSNLREARLHAASVEIALDEWERLKLEEPSAETLRKHPLLTREGLLREEERWSVQRKVTPETDPLEIRIQVYRAGDAVPMYELITFYADLIR